jgi:hypothetical protein
VKRTPYKVKDAPPIGPQLKIDIQKYMQSKERDLDQQIQVLSLLIAFSNQYAFGRRYSDLGILAIVTQQAQNTVAEFFTKKIVPRIEAEHSLSFEKCALVIDTKFIPLLLRERRKVWRKALRRKQALQQHHSRAQHRDSE